MEASEITYDAGPIEVKIEITRFHGKFSLRRLEPDLTRMPIPKQVGMSWTRAISVFQKQ